MDYNLSDPYDNDFYQAKLFKQTKKTFFKTNKINIQIHISITLTKGGVNLIYNPEIIKFSCKDRQTQFRREINAFFIRHGFILDAIEHEVPIYSCGSPIDSINSNTTMKDFIYEVKEDYIDKEDAKELNRIISFLMIEKEMFL